ncbi:hypothetical protein BUE80_DR003618 [Diplocarpon rosae]|nr:hypothetical protein BUE80_DR003618 [Diplocarpon rosae]
MQLATIVFLAQALSAYAQLQKFCAGTVIPPDGVNCDGQSAYCCKVQNENNQFPTEKSCKNPTDNAGSQIKWDCDNGGRIFCC